MNRTFVRGALIAAIAVSAVSSYAAAPPPFYVSDSANATANAGLALVWDDGIIRGTSGSDGHSYGTGKLQQTTVIGTTLANTSGTAYEPDTQSLISQFAGSNIEDTAEIGALHSTISANTNSGAADVRFDAGNAAGSATNDVAWGDTVFFHSNNPNGSHFTAAITLDVAIDPIGTFGLIESGFFTGKATASLDIHGNIDLSQVFHPALFVSDVESLHSDGTFINNIAASPTASFTFFVPFGSDVTLTFDATLETQAFATMGDGQALVNAGNTALFSLATDDPTNASYIAQSGTIFASSPPSVPEPASLALIAGSAVPLLTRRRRSRQM